MYSFSYLEPVCCSMSSSFFFFFNFLFLLFLLYNTVLVLPYIVMNPPLLLPDLHIGFSRGRSGGLVFPSLSEFSTVYCDPHKGFGIVNKAEIDVFLELSCFFHDPADVGIWSLVALPFLKPAWTSGNSRFRYCWSLAWRILSITLLACEMSAIVR